jgi:hypothetical protein
MDSQPIIGSQGPTTLIRQIDIERRHMRYHSHLNLVAIIASVLAMCSSAQAQRPNSIEFFENQIRPVLVEHCGFGFTAWDENGWRQWANDQPGKRSSKSFAVRLALRVD